MTWKNLIELERELLRFRRDLRERTEEEMAQAVSVPVAEELIKADDYLQEAQERLQKARLTQEDIMGGFE